MNINKIEITAECPICETRHAFNAETFFDLTSDCDKAKAIAKCKRQFVTIYFRIHNGNIVNIMAYKGGFHLQQNVRKTLFYNLLKSVISSHLGITQELMESNSRKTEAVFARAVTFYLFRKKFPGISKTYLGKGMKSPKSHPAVLHNLRKIENIMTSNLKQDLEQKRLIEEIESIIEGQKEASQPCVKPSLQVSA